LEIGLVSLQTCDSFTGLGYIRFMLGFELVEGNLQLLVLDLDLVCTFTSSG
jgi:hypothetical protein